MQHAYSIRKTTIATFAFSYLQGGPKTIPQTHVLILSNLNRFSKFFVKTIFSKFAVKYLLKIPPKSALCCQVCHTTLWNNNVTKQANRLQGCVATFLKCGGVVNNQINKGLLLSLPVKKIKSVNISQNYTQEGGCLLQFLRLLAVFRSGAQSARDNHVLACNFAKYSPILIVFTGRLSNKPSLIWLLTTWQPHHTLNMLLHYHR